MLLMRAQTVSKHKNCTLQHCNNWNGIKRFSLWSLRSHGLASEETATSALSHSLKVFHIMCIKYVPFFLTFNELLIVALTITLREVGTGQL